MRASGILMPVFSLPGKYGIGGFTEEAYRFVDFLREAGQKYWQILPLGPTGYGDSPYQSFSTFAGNPYFISLEALEEKGLLTEEELEAAIYPEEGRSVCRIDYGWLYQNRYTTLRLAFDRWAEKKDASFDAFIRANEDWIGDYALFMALKDFFGGVSFGEWPEDIRFRRPEAMEREKKVLAGEICFYEFLQYEFACQWKALKDYANRAGIGIIGDVPIYVSPDSADFWAAPELFQVDGELRPVAVAGCPPDGFSADGQLWGNPLYDWDYHRQTGFAWWCRRLARCRELYDVVRIDHFRGFAEYYSIPAGEETAVRGCWREGPGIDLFDRLGAEVRGVEIIAEDLGYITDSVRELVSQTGFPNMKVLEFAFDSRDSSGRLQYYPHNYGKTCVAYTGTHDNETLAGWLSSILPEEREELEAYLGMEGRETSALTEACIRAVEASVADLAVIPIQDWLGLGNEARINHPSTLGSNWCWRLEEGAADPALAARVLKMTEIYGRIG